MEQFLVKLPQRRATAGDKSAYLFSQEGATQRGRVIKGQSLNVRPD